MVKDKATFLKLSSEGKLGNFLRMWPTLAALEADDYNGYITIRSRDKQSPWFIPVAFACQAAAELEKISQQGGPGESSFYFQEIPPPTMIRSFNLEAIWDELGLYIMYERHTIQPVRGIRERGTEAVGLKARAIFQMLDPSSREQLEAIWEEHPTSIIEASEFTCPVGFYNKRLVIWEVRDF